VADPAHDLRDAVRAGLQAAADPVKAPRMQAYMKSAMPFYGVSAPGQKALFKIVFVDHPLPDRATWLRAVERLWRAATHREERYAAIALSGSRAYAPYQHVDLVSGLHAELVSTGAWWDYVDEIAIRRIGPLLRAEPAAVTPIMRVWATDSHPWKRRTAIICQIGDKEATDRDLLTFAIDANTDEQDFFIRKAIGWALRELAKRDPAWVRSFVADRRAALSGLSQREAFKNIGPQPTSGPVSEVL
jgi:3-methyladenine DNA glycosylase AlkD